MGYGAKGGYFRRIFILPLLPSLLNIVGTLYYHFFSAGQEYRVWSFFEPSSLKSFVIQQVALIMWKNKKKKDSYEKSHWFIDLSNKMEQHFLSLSFFISMLQFFCCCCITAEQFLLLPFLGEESSPTLIATLCCFCMAIIVEMQSKKGNPMNHCFFLFLSAFHSIYRELITPEAQPRRRKILKRGGKKSGRFLDSYKHTSYTLRRGRMTWTWW